MIYHHLNLQLLASALIITLPPGPPFSLIGNIVLYCREMNIYHCIGMQSVQEMVMLSTSVLNIKWTIKGKAKSLVGSIGGDLIIKVNSRFTLNQISGQVVEHEEQWDLSGSSLIAQAYFWASRRLFATVEAGKDVADIVKDLTSKSAKDNKNMDVYPDPYGDPAKVFLLLFSKFILLIRDCNRATQ